MKQLLRCGERRVHARLKGARSDNVYGNNNPPLFYVVTSTRVIILAVVTSVKEWIFPL